MNATLETDYPLQPESACSLIMKGGITSGVIYPRLVSELARSYRLTSIGGSSAGAIAAAAAAIAELRRQRDHDDAGFRALSTLPEDLAKPAGRGSVLLSLFHPDQKTAPLFKALLAILDASRHKSSAVRTLVSVWALLRSYWLRVLLFATPGLLLAGWGVVVGGQTIGIGLIGGLTLALTGALVGGATGAWSTLSTKVPQNLFGLCTGRGGPAGTQALTDWLHTYLQGLAGRNVDDDPVTFGDLAQYGINLRMMTTNLSQGRPMAMPWAEGGYYFRRTDWERLFPMSIVNWMARPENARPLVSGPEGDSDPAVAARAAALGLTRLPADDKLPVIVAVRMSLSFPLLISAVPLVSVQWSKAEAEFVTNWFTDGGVCANFPVHFFDRPISTLPTFAIDLEKTDEPITDDDSASYLPLTNDEGLSRTLLTWEAGEKGTIGRFANAMIGTWQGWVDNEALRMPGYRDRVVTVFTTAQEGGLNLNMDATTVTNLADRGRGAGAKLVKKFTGPFGEDPSKTNGFDNHRWIRLRASVAGLGEWLADFNDAFDRPSPGAISYADLVKLHRDDLPSYRENLQAARTFVRDLRRFSNATDLANLSDGAPRPRARLRLTPYDRAAAERLPRAPDPDDEIPTE